MSTCQTTEALSSLTKKLSQDTEQLRANWCVPPNAAQALRILVQISKAKAILEIGTSIGFSTLHLAWGALQTGGHITTIDASAERQAIAQTHFKEANVDTLISCLEGDALGCLAQLVLENKTFDFVFVDARKSEYLAYLETLSPLMSKGSLFVADNTHSHRNEMQDFLNAINHSQEWAVADLDTPHGLLIALKQS